MGYDSVIPERRPPALPESLQTCISSTEGSLEGRSIKEVPTQSESKHSCLSTKITQIFHKISHGIRAILLSIQSLVMKTHISKPKVPSEISQRINQLAGHYFHTGGARYKALEAEVALFEDINSLERGSVLSSTQKLTTTANRELIDLKPLLSTARYQNYEAFLRTLSAAAIGGQSCSAIANASYELRNISRNYKGPVAQLHKKLEAAFEFVRALENLSSAKEMSLTQAVQSYTPEKFQLLKTSFHQVKAFSGYTDRRDKVTSILKQEAQRQATQERKQKEPEKASQTARDAQESAILIAARPSKIPLRSYQPSSAYTYTPVKEAVYTAPSQPMTTYTEERGGETIQSCRARGEDPVEVLGHDEYQRQSRALEKLYPKEPELDWGERKGYW